MISARINEINKRKMKEKLTRNWFLEKKEKKESEVTQPCLTLCSSMDCSPPGSSVHGILQARILEWVAIPFPTQSWTQVSCIAGRFFTVWATSESESEVTQSCPTLCDPMDCSLPGSEEPLSPWNFPGKSTGVGFHFLLQRIFLTQGSNPGLPKYR